MMQRKNKEQINKKKKKKFPLNFVTSVNFFPDFSNVTTSPKLDKSGSISPSVCFSIQVMTSDT